MTCHLYFLCVFYLLQVEWEFDCHCVLSTREIIVGNVLVNSSGFVFRSINSNNQNHMYILQLFIITWVVLLINK